MLKLKNFLTAILMVGILIPIISCNEKHTSEGDNQTDSVILNKESQKIADDLDNEIYSIKKMIYQLYFISSWLEETDSEGLPIYSKAMLNEFNKYNINKELPKIYEHDAYKDYLTADFKCNQFNDGYTAIWQSSIPDFDFLYDYNIETVNFIDNKDATATLVNGQSVIESGPYMTRVFKLRKEDGRWKICGIDYKE